MRIAGIVAEYNPFHNGHAWQIAEAKRLGAEVVVVAMSCGAVQRGELPLLPEHIRARAAVEAGADIVLALPAWWACAGAEQFAAAGVALLGAAGCDTLFFGAETPDAALLQAAAEVLLSEQYTRELRRLLGGEARSFAAARAAAAEAVCPGRGLAGLLARPNDNLAVEYCKAIRQAGWGITPCPLPRVGAQHGAPLAAGQARYASAGALRALWHAEGPQALAPYVPAAALELYRQASAAGCDTEPLRFDVALLSRLRGLGLPQLRAVRGVNEGLEHRLLAAIPRCTTAQQLYDALTTVRYPRARMRRLCLDAAVGCTAGQAAPCRPGYLHVLAARRAALPLLKQASLPVATGLAKLEKADAQAVAVQRQFDAFATLCRKTPAPAGECFTQKAFLL